MSGSLVKRLLTFLLIAGPLAAGLSLSTLAQSVDNAAPSRNASFMPSGAAETDEGYSGLATAPPMLVAPQPAPSETPVSPFASSSTSLTDSASGISPTPVPNSSPAMAAPPLTPATPAVSASPAPAVSAATASAPFAPIISTPPVPPPSQVSPLSAPAVSAAAPPVPPQTPAPPPAVISSSLTVPSDTAPKKLDIAIQPVSTIPLPNVSAESVGTQSLDGLGPDMWKETPRVTAEALLSIISPTSSSTLNLLARRLLVTEAISPEGTASSAENLTSLRVEKLVNFGDARDAWQITQHADAKLIDDITFHYVAENALNVEGIDPCATMTDFTKARSGADWQKFQIVCQLRSKDTKTAQVALDVLRTQTNRDTLFLDIADKNILGESKKLPYQLTPLTPANLALLRLTGLPLPSDLYGRPEPAIVPGLLRCITQQDVARLSLAEHAAERGLITNAELAAVYRSIPFSADALASAQNSSESGLRLRALLFRASETEKESQKRIIYAVKFMQSASPSFINGTNSFLADMLGPLKADETLSEHAVAITYIYALANQRDMALSWLKLAQSKSTSADDLQILWPQFALAGLESDNSFADSLDKWIGGALKSPDAQGDLHTAHENIAAVLLLLDAAGFKVPEIAWARVLDASHNEKHYTFSPLLFDRLKSAGEENRRAETVLLATALAGDNVIPLPVAINITRALRSTGFKSEAAIFARQTIALLGKSN